MSAFWKNLKNALLSAPDNNLSATAVPAAVLLPILDSNPKQMLLTRRSADLKDHAGQVAFPGGRVEKGESFDAAALREAAEEVGLNPKQAEILGFLPTLTTGTGFSIVPVVAKISAPFDFERDTFEVAEIFSVPLDFLMNPKNHKKHRIFLEGQMREFWAMPYHGYFIWGATAHILRELYNCQNPR